MPLVLMRHEVMEFRVESLDFNDDYKTQAEEEINANEGSRSKI